jgi:hypothetical protein
MENILSIPLKKTTDTPQTIPLKKTIDTPRTTPLENFKIKIQTNNRKMTSGTSLAIFF